jgi:hypothetical protein
VDWCGGDKALIHFDRCLKSTTLIAKLKYGRLNGELNQIMFIFQLGTANHGQTLASLEASAISQNSLLTHQA